MGVVKEAFGEGVEPGVKASVQGAIDRLSELGAKVSEASLPHADYGLSAQNIKPLWQQWVEDAGDENERELRRRLSASPSEAMAQVLESLERDHGSVRSYLLDGGVPEDDLDNALARLR